MTSRGPIAWWRRSLSVRVTATTILLSLIVVGFGGVFLYSRVTSGLIEAKQNSSVAEATVGVNEAQRISDAANTGGSTPPVARVVDTIVAALGAQSGNPSQYDVLLLSSQGGPERGTNLVAVSSLPIDLRARVGMARQQAWTYTMINYLDGRSVPGVVVGAPLNVVGNPTYELYYLFPLTAEAATLDLVRSTVLLTGLLLVVLVGLVAMLVTRLVVRPVRSAALIAERFSEGDLDERMEVRGTDDLARLATAFNEMAASLQVQIVRLEDLSRLQQRFVSDVSHELRTPLTTIRMAADILHEARMEFDPASSRSAELLQTQLDRFEALLTDLLEISRYDAGVAVLEHEPMDVRVTARQIIDNLSPLAVAKGSRVNLIIPESPCVVEADARRVHRVLSNLVANAIEHGEGRPIIVTAASNGECASITVRDFGVGLQQGEDQRVFDRFWRADPARARTTGGTGLGLAISLEDARLHGGELVAWGEPGLGACFRLTLPCVSGGSITVPALPLPDSMAVHAAAHAVPFSAGLNR